MDDGGLWRAVAFDSGGTTEFLRADLAPPPPALSGDAVEAANELRSIANDLDECSLEAEVRRHEDDKEFFAKAADANRKAASKLEAQAREIAANGITLWLWNVAVHIWRPAP
jgi:hypothetical protein